MTATAKPLASPSDILLEAVVSLLAPLLTAGCAGDPVRIRLATIETVASYQARNQSELVKIMQIVGFGLMAMDNLRLSMTPGLPLSMVLRLRAGANALNRSAQQNARALENSRRTDWPPNTADLDPALADPFPTFHNQEITEADILASIQRARGLVRDARSRMQDEQPIDTQPVAANPVLIPPAPVACPASAAPPKPATPLARQTAATAEHQRKLLWADAMNDVASELHANQADVSEARFPSNLRWAEALSSSASSLALAAGGVSPGETSASNEPASGQSPPRA